MWQQRWCVKNSWIFFEKIYSETFFRSSNLHRVWAFRVQPSSRSSQLIMMLHFAWTLFALVSACRFPIMRSSKIASIFIASGSASPQPLKYQSQSQLLKTQIYTLEKLSATSIIFSSLATAKVKTFWWFWFNWKILFDTLKTLTSTCVIFFINCFSFILTILLSPLMSHHHTNHNHHTTVYVHKCSFLNLQKMFLL